MAAARPPLRFDPIAEAQKNWENAGWAEYAEGMAFVTSIMRAQQLLLARVDEVLAPHGLTFARFEVLMLLSFTRSGHMPLGKIGQRLQVHPASVTNAIDRLEAGGLVERVRHPSDGRTTLATITPAGAELTRRAVADMNAKVFARIGLEEAETRTVVQALAALRALAGDFAGE
jgi:DNA-binding MarR family transcriptional regulator